MGMGMRQRMVPVASSQKLLKIAPTITTSSVGNNNYIVLVHAIHLIFEFF
jgi:hypothetical protein